VGGPVRSPGQCDLHYAPRAQIELVCCDAIAGRAVALLAAGKRVVILGDRRPLEHSEIPSIPLPSSANEMARVLYHALREVDRQGYDVALVSLPPESGMGAAIADRLRRAAGPRAAPLFPVRVP
jgi:L-threonylcarbamoyladenylate synthase